MGILVVFNIESLCLWVGDFFNLVDLYLKREKNFELEGVFVVG